MAWAAARGAEIRIGCGVRGVIVEGGRAAGVVTERGEAIRARAVVSNLNPKLLCSAPIEPSALPDSFREHMA